MKAIFAKSLLAVSLTVAGVAQAAPAAGQFSANDQNVSLSQLYPGAYQAGASSDKSREQVNTELSAAQKALHAGKFASDSEGASLAALYPASESAPVVASRLSRDEVRRDYQQARAAGELRNSDTGLTDREIFPQQYAGKPAARVQ
jgi:hypothetical protein